MIRHKQRGEFLLFTQDDHARLSGQLAARFGNARFAPPMPLHSVVDAVAMHDSGWPLHDARPTLNPQGLPLHVFETPPRISVRVWTESARLAREKGPYTGLLVSLHVFALSALSHQHYSDPETRQRHAAEVFALNKFQQAQIEMQEQIRRELGLRTDLPLSLGLAPLCLNETEDLLRFNYEMLKAMDQISLALLCDSQPFASIEAVCPRPGQEPIVLRVGYVEDWTVTVSPWPFADPRLEARIPFRRVAGQPFASEQEFQDAYAHAQEESVVVKVMGK